MAISVAGSCFLVANTFLIDTGYNFASYASGSTGVPKGRMHSHYTFVRAIHAVDPNSMGMYIERDQFMLLSTLTLVTLVTIYPLSSSCGFRALYRILSASLRQTLTSESGSRTKDNVLKLVKLESCNGAALKWCWASGNANLMILRDGRCGLAQDRLSITGRKKHFIICLKELIAPTEIEDAMLNHPAVSEVVVVPRSLDGSDHP
ncbi:uncharacterized protein LOC111268796 [Varroa jacobsoni]|uniref:uncharacterized protein LOC111268796 n=1 Tax=Varroa jacobsoni TaxID=62625 RepID=UPI000BF6C2D1|nr:uncharacterized protein LOC111268796 [Varroa jacobsoni]